MIHTASVTSACTNRYIGSFYSILTHCVTARLLSLLTYYQYILPNFGFGRMFWYCWGLGVYVLHGTNFAYIYAA